MNVLAVDCSFDMMSVCVCRSIDKDINKPELPKHPYKDALKPKVENALKKTSGYVEISIDSGYKHAEKIITVIESCIKEAGLEPSDLDLLSCALGPGSFTGLRIGLSTIKGLAMGLNKPFVLVPTLDAIASSWEGTSRYIIPVIDAKRSHFYFALYENSKLVSGPFDGSLEQLLALAEPYPEILFTGPDADMLEDSISERSGFRLATEHRRSSVKAMAHLAAKIFEKQGGAKTDAGLCYIRASDAEEARK